MLYTTTYKFTEDEIKALEELEKTLPSSAGLEVIQDIIRDATINGYRADSIV